MPHFTPINYFKKQHPQNILVVHPKCVGIRITLCWKSPDPFRFSQWLGSLSHLRGNQLPQCQKLLQASWEADKAGEGFGVYRRRGKPIFITKSWLSRPPHNQTKIALLLSLQFVCVRVLRWKKKEPTNSTRCGWKTHCVIPPVCVWLQSTGLLEGKLWGAKFASYVFQGGCLNIAVMGQKA